MDFLLRDDDICFFTKLEDFKKVWSWFLETDCAKLNLAVIPFVDLKEFNITEEVRLKPLEENKELVIYLKKLIKKKKIEILLHGYSHTSFGKKFEFSITDKESLLKKIKKAKFYLENLLETKISIFVPPHNRLSKEALEAIKENKLDILASFPMSFFKIGFNLKYFYFFIKRFLFSKINYNCLKGFYFYPYILNFDSHKQLDCFNFLPNLFDFQDLLRLTYKIKKIGGSLCLTVHWWELKEMNLELLKTFICKLIEDNQIMLKFASEVFDD
ncbi:MAG: DUF2334 domain-containing protein [Candidatus Omnitrophica bacterium]|nr:DUF2334 domain-containing protein [Candidatus Omnitrophota bacterium]